MITKEMNKLRFCDSWPLQQALGYITMPSGRVLKGGDEFNSYETLKRRVAY